MVALRARPVATARGRGRSPAALPDCDSLGVVHRAQHAGMTIQLICPWCEDEVAFTIDDAAAELTCNGCATRMAFAPDPATTYDLLYEPAAA